MQDSVRQNQRVIGEEIIKETSLFSGRLMLVYDLDLQRISLELSSCMLSVLICQAVPFN